MENVRVAHFDPGARRVVGASLDGTARVWDAARLSAKLLGFIGLRAT
ncbi:MAG TPA: hypothetical protein VF469_23975 [Kofleriaceae bacterium]